MAEPGNILYYGDNLDVLKLHVPDECVDLIYLDPPFNSKATYNVLFAQAGVKAAAQIKAFDDTWHWDQVAAAAFEEVVVQGGDVAQAMVAFRTLLGASTMLAYLSMMAPRLIELRRVLKDTGTLYLHCDPTASHYLKLLLDATFGPTNFQNEIIWSYKSGGATAKRFARKHDVIFSYSKTGGQSGAHHFEALRERSYNREDKPYRFKGVEEFQDESGRWYTMPYMRDVWEIDMVGRTSKERLSYPTQKPVALLDRIIRTSCPADGVVLDPFCGCGTTVAAAEKLNRRWVGIDITYLAISLIKSRLARDGVSDYAVLGEPTTPEDAAQLAEDDKYQFQWWALGLIGARPAKGKKGADRGIDGRLYFFDDAAETPKQLIASIKGGTLKPGDVRDLVGVVQREQAQLGVLISFNEPTQPMRTEAATAGFYKSPWGTHPKIQLLTVAELLAGKRIDMPAGGAQMTQVALPPVPEVHPGQLSLDG